MRTLLLTLPGLMLLCGFGVAPDPMRAVPKAEADRKQAVAQCRGSTEMKPFADALDCILAADRTFAQAIDLRDAAMVDAYAARVALLTADLNAGKLKAAEAATRFAALESDFFKTANAEFAARIRDGQAFARASHGNLSAGDEGRAEMDR